MNPREIAESWLWAGDRNSTDEVKSWLQCESWDKLISELLDDWYPDYAVDQPSRDELKTAFAEIQKDLELNEDA